MADASGPTDPPFTETREFWVLMGYAFALGVLGAFAGLVFMGVIKLGGKWYDDSNPSWFGGHWWWVAVTAATGVVVWLLRRLTRLPAETPGLIEDLKSGHVEPQLVPGIVAVSAVSLIGGASLGPEKALGSIGGGAGSWISDRRRLDTDASEVTVLSGFAGAYGGLFSSPVIVVMMLLEIARPGGQRFAKALVGTIVASSVSFGIYFAIAGAVFLNAYEVPQYKFEDWQLLAGIPLGLFAAVVVTILVVFMQLSGRLFGRNKLPSLVKPIIGGVLFGIVGVILPLTLFTGSNQLKTVLHDAGTLGVGLLGVLVIAKIFTFAVSQASGFVGGSHLPGSFHWGHRRSVRPRGDPRRSVGARVYMHARCGTWVVGGRTIFDGPACRIPDSGRPTSNRPRSRCRRNRLSCDGGCQIPPREPSEGKDCFDLRLR